MKQKKKRGLLVFVFILIVLGILVAGWYYAGSGPTEEIPEEQPEELEVETESEEGILDEDQIAVKVDEKEIKVGEFMEVIKRVESEYGIGAANFDEQEIFEHAVDIIVQEIMLTRYASREGIEVSEKEIEEEYSKAEEEGLLSQMKEEEINESEVDDLLEKEIKAQKLTDQLKKEVDLEGAEYEEVKELREYQQELAPEEEIESDNWEEEFIQRQASSLLSEQLEKLREEADVEVLITEEQVFN